MTFKEEKIVEQFTGAKNPEEVDVDLFEGYEAVNMIFISRTNPTATISTYELEIPSDMKEKIRKKVISEYGEKCTIKIDCKVNIYHS